MMVETAYGNETVFSNIKQIDLKTLKLGKIQIQELLDSKHNDMTSKYTGKITKENIKLVEKNKRQLQNKI